MVKIGQESIFLNHDAWKLIIIEKLRFFAFFVALQTETGNDVFP